MGDRPTVFCKDCKFRWRRFLDSPKCGRQEAVELDGSYLVTAKTRRETCSMMRRDFGPCGPTAKLWEPRK